LAAEDSARAVDKRFDNLGRFRQGPRERRSLILLVVLLMVALLALLAASYAFLVRANLSAVMAEHERFQARMAAESGIQRAIVMLRKSRDDPDYSDDLDRWYNNPKDFMGGLVYGTEGKDTLAERRDEDTTWDPTAKPAWRYNLVAPNYDEPTTVRYGLTDECARLDLNLATEAQLRELLQTVIPPDQDREVDVDQLIDSLLDWRESGSSARPKGAKDDYYQGLDPPYSCKSAPFSTVEELLMVRGFTAWVVFGEDYNRNGLLDQNEDDGDASFPPDNADGLLFPGVAAFLTVWSREFDTSNDNRPRIYLNLPDKEKLREALEDEFDTDVVSYVMTARDQGKTFTSVMDLFPPPPLPEEEEENAAASQPAATTQPRSGRRGATDRSPSSQPTSAGTSENAGGQEGGLSDLDQSENAPAAPAWKRKEYTELLPGVQPPGSAENMPLILDRLTVDQAAGFGELKGRINVSTAPREVLATLKAVHPRITDADIDALVAARRSLSGLEKATCAWLRTKNVLDDRRFRELLDGDLPVQRKGGFLTTRSSVFRVEVVGYADHLGVVERINEVFKVVDPVTRTTQVIYHRNLTGLGPAYNPHGIERRGPGTGSM